MNRKEEYNKFTEQKIFKMTKHLSNLISAKAQENRTSESEIMRQALMQYLNRNINDSEIVHASLVETKRKINYLEKKIEVLAILFLEQTKYLMSVMPDKKGSEYSLIVEKRYSEFMQVCANSLKANHNGVLESMILDFYEQGNSN